ncbi:MAG: hypothetical protein EOP43_06070 [Sphingobacteriaceae bacterium]|nr:MAG: hypothetical protein EOP43_06070 [Sphingobacteriaceae bacterium]
MKYYFLIVSQLLSFNCFSQTKINTTLKKQLDSVMVLDQKYREALSLMMTDTSKTDSLAKVLNFPRKNLNGMLWKKQLAIDSANVVFIEDIFKRYGYPGKSLVGTPTNETAWYIIQHSFKIPQYLPMMKEAGQKSELPFRLVAMMEDRYLMNENKEQVYGTQGTRRTLKNGKTEWIVWPIQKPEQVNQRRKQAGFEQTVEENAKTLGINYRVVKLSEVELK